MITDQTKSTRDKLLEVIGAKSGITREEIIATTGLPSGAVDPSRIRLWEAGLVEPASDAGWEEALANRVKGVGWRLVEDSTHCAEVAARAKTRRKRNAKSAEERARRIVEDLDDLTVNRLVLAMTKDGVGSRRAGRRVEQTLRKQHMDRRQQARQAERDKTADADFRRMLKQLWEARGAVGAIDTHLIEERARVAAGHPRQIPNESWMVAVSDVRTIIKSFGNMWQNIRDLADGDEPCPACGASQISEDRHLRAFAVDVLAEEDGDEEIVDADIVST